MPHVRRVTIDFDSFQVQTDKNLGVIEVGVFVSLTLFGILLAQAYSFFCRSKEDSSGLKLLVSSLVYVLALFEPAPELPGFANLIAVSSFLETVHTSLASAAVYYDTVTTWKTPAINTYPFAIITIVENLITTMVQLCFSYRIKRLAGSQSLAAFACFVLAILRSLGLCAVSVVAIRDIMFDGGTGVFVVRVSWLITADLTVGSAADMLIAASMIYYLRKLSSPTNVRSTGQVVKGLMRWSIQTGLITSLAHLATIVCTTQGLVWLSIYIVLAKLYSNSLLMILNARPLKGTTVSLYDASSSGSREATISLPTSFVPKLERVAQSPPVEVPIIVEKV
ncbi:hypothetical protein NLJ89_g5560 [Agrocybe chaxingu]|uniref:DUF6534 domain-containing protein n=1 Tax=Agrocybe chaxingu TaxID=84603 RepID=A0A9W8JY97_9AGAR|nr:hypothetical protein NLJ89_g5560 [Agrocybe chaxingu]